MKPHGICMHTMVGVLKDQSTTHNPYGMACEQDTQTVHPHLIAHHLPDIVMAMLQGPHTVQHHPTAGTPLCQQHGPLDPLPDPAGPQQQLDGV